MEGKTTQNSVENRIVSLDMIRGGAILGIFLVNMLSFHSPFLYIDPLEWWKAPLDKWTYIFIDIFIQASFYPLFSMLFGYGLVLLWERTNQKGLHFYPIVFRRLSLLLIVGLAHAFFVWHGDILFNYALLGFIFLLFLRLSRKSMLLIGSVFYILPNLLLLGLLVLTVMMMAGTGTDLSMENPVLISQSLEIYQNGSFLEITVQRIKDWSYTNNLFGIMTQLFTLLPLFLIGGSAAKYKWLEHVGKFRRAFKITFLITLILGVLLKLSPYVISYNVATSFLQDLFGGPLLAISYGLLIVFLAETKGGRKGLSAMSYVGRMSFSNYLFQSIVSTLIFYQYGLGFYGDVSVTWGTILVLIIFMIQIILSRLWLKYYHYGLAEWLWRNFTYWKKQKLRRNVESELTPYK
ncbi:DUF418 domain-containing protein [Niallia sp. Krafla_26]|uniref:DUF418 domain-containing protein n=1 Tax=Niallia sp. Krafla_26 TaxID=3064703 RepID=UPI003D16B2ED